jgi:eukaryotic-like serine/threonine-protein kinase
MDTAQAAALKQSLIGGHVGGWAIEGAHGHGKSAVVMAAIKEGRRGAVKVFHPELVELFGRDVQLERIRRETSLIGSKHENLVEILDGGECGETGHLYVVMEELPWKNLKEALPNVPADKVRTIISQVASAAKYLEDKGLAHRDIKPENIAISADFSKAKLLDLGVIRPFGISDLTDVNARPFIGTLRYSSPEFLRRVEEDSPSGWRAVSLYQLGAVLHDMIMKREIFHKYSEPYPVLVEAVLNEVPEVHGVDANLIRICNYSLVKSPQTRLELVSWADYLEESGSLETSALHESIKQRQRYFREVRTGGDIAEGEERRLLRQQLDAAGNRLDLKLAVLLTSLKCFPLRTTSLSVDVEKLTCSCTVDFEINEQLGLLHRIAATFNLALIDQNKDSPIYRLDVSSFAAMGGGPVEVIAPTALAVGALDDVLYENRIETWLLAMLNAAYEMFDKAQG